MKCFSHFFRNTFDYDFGLMRLSNKINFTATDNIRPVCLPGDNSQMYDGQVATVTGWGTLFTNGPTPAKLQVTTYQYHMSCDTNHDH